MNRTSKTIAAASLILGLALGVPAATASATEEDQPGWSCVSDGNRICGPSNIQGVPAGCYDDGGVLVAVWPCHVVVNPTTGEGDVYTGLAR